MEQSVELWDWHPVAFKHHKKNCSIFDEEKTQRRKRSKRSKLWMKTSAFNDVDVVGGWKRRRVVNGISCMWTENSSWKENYEIWFSGLVDACLFPLMLKWWMKCEWLWALGRCMSDVECKWLLFVAGAFDVWLGWRISF